MFSNAESVAQPNAFSVDRFIFFVTSGFSLRSNPGLKLANAFGVFVQIQTEDYLIPQ